MNTTTEEFKKSVDTYTKIRDLLEPILEYSEKNDLDKTLRIIGLDTCDTCDKSELAYDDGFGEGNSEGYSNGVDETTENLTDEFECKLIRLSEHFNITIEMITELARPKPQERTPCQKSTPPF